MAKSALIKSGKGPDYVFLAAVIILVVFGLIMLSSASSDLGKIKFNDSNYFLKRQLMYGVGLGILGFLTGLFVNYKKWQKLAVPLLGVSILALTLVFTPLGFNAGGANRWINFGQFLFQPAELLKITFIIYLAAWLSKKKERQSSFWEGFLPFLAVVALITGLIFMQPATTIAVVIVAASLIVYFVSGLKMRYVVGFSSLMVLVIALLVMASPYRLERVKNFTGGFHREQALMAIGAGGGVGVGYGNSTNKYNFLPEPIGDSIFAVIAEELGFAGAIFLITLFVIILIRGVQIAANCRDQFSRLVVIGFISIITIQAIVNIGAISGLLPLTGMPLPFVSYGSSSLVIFLTMSGVIGNISKNT